MNRQPHDRAKAQLGPSIHAVRMTGRPATLLIGTRTSRLMPRQPSRAPELSDAYRFAAPSNWGCGVLFVTSLSFLALIVFGAV